MSRDFNKVSPNVWDSRKFRRLENDDARLLYLYLLTNKNCNSVGCYVMRSGYGCADLDWQSDRFGKAIDSLCDVGLIAIDSAEDLVLIANFLTFNEPTNAKHAMSTMKTLAALPRSPLRDMRFQELTETIRRKGHHQDKIVGHQIERLSIAYREGIATKTETETERETQTKTEKKTETETREEFSAKPSVADPPAPLAPDGAARSVRPRETMTDYRLQTPMMAKGAH